MGETAQIVAALVDAAGVKVPGVTCTFTSLDTAVVTVESSGLVHSVGTGIADVAVQCGEKNQHVRIVVRLSIEAEAALGTYRLTQANGGSLPRYIGLFLGNSGAEVYYNQARLTLRWDSTTARPVVSYSDTTMYKSFDSIQGNQTWFDPHSYDGTWSLANGDLSMTFTVTAFKLAHPRVSGNIISLSTNPGMFGKAADSVALTLMRFP